MAKFHLTEEGPKPCNANVRECPIGGAHFESKDAADRAYEGKLASEHATPSLTKSPSTLPELDTKGLKYGTHLVDGVEIEVGGAENINWRSDCAACVRNGKGAFAPSHDASTRCQSGGRPHCTCDACF